MTMIVISIRTLFTYPTALLIWYICIARIYGYRRILSNRDDIDSFRRLIDSEEYADIFDSTNEIDEEESIAIASKSVYNRSLSASTSSKASISMSEHHRVKSLPGLPSSIADTLIQYAGYINIDAEKNSNVFYWLFEAPSNADALPLLIWLNGGPG